MKERTLLKQLQRKNEKALEEIMKKYGAYMEHMLLRFQKKYLPEKVRKKMWKK